LVKKFITVEEALSATTIEMTHQIQQWGEVEFGTRAAL